MAKRYLSVFIFILMICGLSLVRGAGTNDKSGDIACNVTTDTSVVNNYINYCFEDKTFMPFAIYNSLEALELAKKIKYQKGIDEINYELGIRNYELGIKKFDLSNILNSSTELNMTLYDSLGYYYSKAGQQDKALNCFRSIEELASTSDISISERLKKSELNGIAGCYVKLGIQSLNQEDYEHSIEYENKALIIYKGTGNKFLSGSCYNIIGTDYLETGNSSLALDYFLKSLKINEELEYKIGLANCNSNIGVVYTNEKDYAKALVYEQNALKIYEEIKNKAGILKSYNILGNIYSNKGDDKKAIEFYNNALKIIEELKDEGSMAGMLNNIGDSYKNLGDYLMSLEYFNKALRLNERNDDKRLKVYLLINIADTYLQLKKYNEALEYTLKSLKSAKEIKELFIENNGYRILKELYKLKGEYKKAMEYGELYKSTSDSLYNDKKSKQIVEIQNKYESEKREKKILLLSKNEEVQKLELKKNKIIIYGISSGSILFLIFSLIIFNFYRQRQFRKDLFSKTIETEENERRRFAEDLHDGLGPLLSTIGLYVNELGDKATDRSKEEELLNYTNQLIDNAIKSTKLIANNLMPGDLSQYGLIHAIEYYCNIINKSETVNIKLKTEETKGKYDKTTEIILYRVLMELINNTIKHASAKNININIKDKENKIIMEYRDDGRGFDVESTLKDPVKGLGLNNIINRIKSIEGECEFQSLEGSGTIVKVEINLKHFSWRKK